jgi:hypothetical protein
MPGSLSVASTAVSSGIVAFVDSVEVGWPEVCSKCNNGPRPLSWGTPAINNVLQSCFWSDDVISYCLAAAVVFRTIA